MRKYIILFLLILSLGFVACEKYLEPLGENTRSQAQLLSNPAYAEGLQMRAYINLPTDYNFETDVASDDAVTNDMTSNYRRMAVGEWKSTFDPLEQWTTAYTQIFYINKFLDLYKSVTWSQDSALPKANRTVRNILYLKRLKGESYGIRAWYKSRLLQYHGGLTADNRLLGFPIIDKTLTTSDNWKLPRNTYSECVTSIFNDLDSAIANLPATWFDRPTNRPTNLSVNTGNPVVDQANDATNKANAAANAASGDTNMTLGARYENRINGNTAKALKARVALLAASPSFSAGSGVTWAQAATIAGPLLKNLGALYANGRVFYKEMYNKEIIWNRAQTNIRTWETSNFPPSLFGSGRTNPTQNLVDAFGMKNGYPITHASSGYNAATPYTNRDQRLTDYIVYNTATLKNTSIKTYIGAPSDGINVLPNSTRTGYYLKKLLLETVNLNSNSLTSANHTMVFVRMTELLLNYAEAANEAWGPDGDPNGYGFTARTLIKDLRIRAGITQPDAYLASITDAAGLRTLIRNERRIELCFEGFRFWDIRRWGDVATLQASVNAANITNTAGVYTYNYTSIEERKFTPDMIYGPVPYNETLKYNLDQNKGW